MKNKGENVMVNNNTGKDTGNTSSMLTEKKTLMVSGKPISLRGNVFIGTVVSSKMHSTVTVEWSRRYHIKKYERYETRRTRVKAHNPPEMNAKEGDAVKIMGCRPLSKTKNFVVIENLGPVKGYNAIKEAMQEAKVKQKEESELANKKAKQSSQSTDEEETENASKKTSQVKESGDNEADDDYEEDN